MYAWSDCVRRLHRRGSAASRHAVTATAVTAGLAALHAPTARGDTYVFDPTLAASTDDGE